MPNYMVHLDTGASSAEQRAALVREISTSHSVLTGAPPSFVQVIISHIGGEHFIGGEPVDARAVFLHGHIRDGRSTNAKDALIAALRDAVRDHLRVPEDLIWVYLSEIPAAQMIEYGRVLPTPGHEQAWQAELPDEVRARVSRLDDRLLPRR
jgi:phenylpyruvate tautomerase PptA (4-oxalocrotonate tautomerase family)